MAKKYNEFLKYRDISRWYFEVLVKTNALPKSVIVRELSPKKVRIFYERGRRKG